MENFGKIDSKFLSQLQIHQLSLTLSGSTHASSESAPTRSDYSIKVP